MRTARRVIFVVVFAFVALASVIYHETLQAQWRAAVVGADLYQIPVLSGLTGAVTSAPSVRTVTIGGAPTTVCQPKGNGQVPAVVFITGADAAGRENQDLVRTCRALARSGIAMYLPDLPGLREGTIGAETLKSTVDYVIAASNEPRVAGGQVSLASASTGASLALLVAGDERARGRVRMVAGISPYADVRTVVQLATTSSYETADGSLATFTPEEWLRVAIARSLTALLAESGLDPVIANSLRQQIDQSEDPFDPFRSLPTAVLSQRARALVAVMANTDGDRFAQLWSAVPADMRARADQLSPVSVAEQIDMPVELVVAPQDKYFPSRESERLVGALPNARLVTTDALNHASPDASGTSFDGGWEMNRFLVRSLRAADVD